MDNVAAVNSKCLHFWHKKAYVPLPALDWDLWANVLCQMSHSFISCLFHKSRLWGEAPISHFLKTRFHFCVARSFPLTSTNSVAAAAMSTRNTVLNKEEWAVDWLFQTSSQITSSILPSVHTAADSVRHGATSCAMSHSPNSEDRYLSSLCSPYVWITQWEQKVVNFYLGKCLGQA